MELLISKEDVFNKLNIDLEAYLGVKGQSNNTTVVQAWLDERQREIIDVIADYAYNGIRQAKRLLVCSCYREEIKRAVLAQCEYVYTNSNQSLAAGIILNQGGVSSKLSADERLDANLAPRAYQILLNAGLLYSGRCR